jgi:hypothetical protein
MPSTGGRAAWRLGIFRGVARLDDVPEGFGRRRFGVEGGDCRVSWWQDEKLSVINVMDEMSVIYLFADSC